MSENQIIANANHEQRVRERAHAIWQSEGEPEGRDLEHWMAAERDIGGEAPQPANLDENISVLGKQANGGNE